MKIRTSKPESGNKFYTTKSKGGYSTCIKGHPTDSCDVLANCVGYACGRFNEIIGSMKYPSLNCNAENFIERAKNTYGLEVSPVPTLGGIMVWQKGATLNGNDGAGHVAIVERIDSNNQIYTSESGYDSAAFWNTLRTNSNGRWGIGSGYTFRGCIINPAIGKVVAPIQDTDIKTKSIEELAREVIAGKYGNGEARKQALGSRYKEVQDRVNEILLGKNTAKYLSNKNYKGYSIVDALKQIKVNSSFSYRSKLAQINGITNYKGTADQNIKMLNMLKNGTLKSV